MVVAKSIAASARRSVAGKRWRSSETMGLPRDVRGTEIALEDIAHVVRELLRERLVEVELATEPHEGLGIGALTHHRLHRVTGRDVEQQERHHQHAQEGRHQECHAEAEETHHGFVLLADDVRLLPALAVEDRRNVPALDRSG